MLFWACWRLLVALACPNEGGDEFHRPHDDGCHDGLGHVLNPVEGVLLHEGENLTRGLNGRLHARVVHLEGGDGNHVEMMRPVVCTVHEVHRTRELHEGMVEHAEHVHEEVAVELDVGVELAERERVVVAGHDVDAFFGEVVLAQKKVPHAVVRRDGLLHLERAGLLAQPRLHAGDGRGCHGAVVCAELVVVGAEEGNTEHTMGLFNDCAPFLGRGFVLARRGGVLARRGLHLRRGRRSSGVAWFDARFVAGEHGGRGRLRHWG